LVFAAMMFSIHCVKFPVLEVGSVGLLKSSLPRNLSDQDSKDKV